MPQVVEPLKRLRAGQAAELVTMDSIVERIRLFCTLYDPDRDAYRFVSEYGYVGACAKQSVLEYMDGQPLDPAGECWQHHNNAFEKDTVAAGIAGLGLSGVLSMSP